MKKIITLVGLIFFLGSMTFAQSTNTTKRSAGPVSTRTFIYGNLNYFSFADEVMAKSGNQKEKSRSVFSGYSAGAEYIGYINRYILGFNLNLMSGSVDIARVLGQSYPRKSFYGVQFGPEFGYRVNADLDLSYSLALLYRQIEKMGSSAALANQLNIKFRLSPRLTFFQSFGNYGKATAYSYTVGLRWLL